ncbi:MAG: AAA family ATPase [Candidatus Saccharimonadales bacterium]
MRSTPKLIGLAGTNGSGKDTVGHIISENYGYLFISVTEILRAELSKRGLASTRENLRSLSAQWRKLHGLGVLVDKALEQFHSEKDHYSGLVIASLRNPGEADRVHELNGIMLWIDADPKIRYERIQKNAASRNRAKEDNVSFDKFLAEEEAEMKSADADNKTLLNMSEVKSKCDHILDNSADTYDLLTKAIDQIIE